MRVHVCWNEGPDPFLRVDNNKIAKINWRNSKIFFLELLGQFKPNFAQSFLWWDEWIQLETKKDHSIKKKKKGDNFLINSMKWSYHVQMCLLFGTFYRVRDVAHGPLLKYPIDTSLSFYLYQYVSTTFQNTKLQIIHTVCFPVFFHEETHDFISKAKTKQGAEAGMEFALWRGTVRNYPGKYDTKEAYQCLSGDVMIYFYLKM